MRSFIPRLSRVDLVPGQSISETVLAKELAVSRTPVREALQRLQREGLVLVLPQRGTFVANLDIRAIRSAYFIRLSLEKAVASEAARLCAATDVKGLQAMVEEQHAVLAADDAAAFFELNRAFHQALVAIADLSGVAAPLASASNHLNRVRVAHLRYGGPYPLEPIVAEHRAIVAAIAARDSAEAERQMHLHIAKALPRIDLIQSRQPDFFVVPGRIAGLRRLHTGNGDASAT